MSANTGGAARDLPLYPFLDESDERTEGVLLLEHDAECKTTAEPLTDAWRITEWEVATFDGRPCWFARSWYVIPSRHIAMLAARSTEAK